MMLLVFSALLFVQLCLGAGDRVVVYWGQNSAGWANPDPNYWEKPLRHYCEDSTYDILQVSFLHIFFDSRDPSNLPALNFAYHCETYFPDHPTLLNCPAIGEDIKYCQSKGKTVILSLGGASGTYGFTSDAQAVTFATTIWDMFLGGNSTAVPKPFGEGVILDGVDLDIEGGTNVGYGTFVNELRKYFTRDPSRTYIIGAAPQCVHPDAFLGPGSGTAFSNSPFDYVTVQFYNNWCGLQNYDNPDAFNFNVWSSWGSSSPNPNVEIFVGAPASSSAAGSGYVEIERLKQIAGELRGKYNNFGGIMLWDAGQAALNNNYGKQISDYLKGKGGIVVV